MNTKPYPVRTGHAPQRGSLRSGVISLCNEAPYTSMMLTRLGLQRGAEMFGPRPFAWFQSLGPMALIRE